MPHLFVMSVDSLFTEELADVRNLPGFGQILPRAAIFEHVDCVYPTLTFVCHASIMTGCWPDKHGVHHNQVLDPATEDSAWHWDAASIKVPTILDYAKAAGLSTAAVSWPVTVGASAADVNVPEMWVSNEEAWNGPDLLAKALDELYEKNCTPYGHELYLRHRDVIRYTDDPQPDEFDVRCVEDILREKKPDVFLTHQASLDHARHFHGVKSPEAREALRRHDAWIARCIEAMKDAGTYDDTIFVILGDHGHVPIEARVAPNILLRDAGLINVDESGRVTDWRAYVLAGGASGQLFVRDESDLPAAMAALQSLVDDGLISDVLTREEVGERFHEGGDFELMLEGAPGYGVVGSVTGKVVTPSSDPDYYYAVSTHGHLPFRGPKPPFVVAGPGVVPGRYVGARLVDQAPALMNLAGIPFDATDLDGEDLFAEGSRAVHLPG